MYEVVGQGAAVGNAGSRKGGVAGVGTVEDRVEDVRGMKTFVAWVETGMEACAGKA